MTSKERAQKGQGNGVLMEQRLSNNGTSFCVEINNQLEINHLFV